MVRGTVRFWREEKGWGVIDSALTPGGCWTHFSFIEADGYKTLRPGQEVHLDWEVPAQGNYEGYPFFATPVVPIENHHGEAP